MKKLIAIALLATAALPAVASAASATAERSAHVPLSFSNSREWYRNHRAPLFKAANCEITQDLGGNQFKVKTKTPLGTWHYVVRETVTVSPSDVTIQITLVDKLDTKLTRVHVTIRIQPAENGSLVSLSIAQSVKLRLLPSAVLRKHTGKSLTGIKDYLLAHAR